MSKRKFDNTDLSEAIRNFVESNKLQHGLDQVDVEHAWQEIMGQAVNQYTTSVSLKGDTLYVNLSSSVLREELSYGKAKIINILNEALGKSLIKKIVLR